MKWITRQRPKIDRVACPWLIARFIDREPEFLFAAPSEVRRLAGELGAIPFDVEGVELSHEGPLCSFDALLRKYQLTDPALDEIAGAYKDIEQVMKNQEDLVEVVAELRGVMVVKG